MELIFDDFSDITGWVASDASIILTANKFSSHILSGNQSLQIKVEGSSGHYFEKQYASPINISEFENLRIAVSKYRSKSSYSRNQFSEFKMKIAIGDTVGGVFTPSGEWFIPVFGKQMLESVNIELPDVDSFDTIRFTLLDDEYETWWLDHFIVCNDEFVIDSLLAIKQELDCKIATPLGNPLTALSAGSEVLELPDWVNVSRYSVIQISEGNISEKHIVAGEVSNGTVQFEDESYFDGKALVNDFTTAATISLVVPAIIAGKFAPIAVPGIYIAGFIPVTDKMAQVDTVRDSFRVDTKRFRLIQPRRDLKLPVQIEVQCSLPELMVSINNYIQHLFSDTGVLLINGIKHDLIYEDTPKYDPGDLEGDIPYSVHFYSVNIIDVLSAQISYVDIPVYNLNFGVYTL